MHGSGLAAIHVELAESICEVALTPAGWQLGGATLHADAPIAPALGARPIGWWLGCESVHARLRRETARAQRT